MAKRPNILLFMVDELRYPPVYDGPELRDWMRTNLVAQTLFRETGVELDRHYAMSSACVPSRASIFTGQYPSLHGVSQTDGIGKNAWDPGMFWLDPDTVPTMGDWFRAGGYQTHYKGKWHVSFADILVPGTKNSLPSNDDEGVPYPQNVETYRAGDRLDDYGFTGWIGPEPHGSAKANCGMVRDPHFAAETRRLIDELEARKDDDTPFLIVNSYTNPHDIVFFGLKWEQFGFPFTDGTIPDIPEPPTRGEDLSTKPTCQQSYVDNYPKMFLRQPTIELYRQFYYYLQKQVEAHILSVYEHFKKSRFFENTIIVFTSDHGEMLGAHGGMHQKWYQSYEETIHVPMVFAGPLIPSTPRRSDVITSHADIIPTLLGLAGIDVDAAHEELERTHNEVRRLVGRDLSRVVMGTGTIPPGEPVYFATTDDVAQGLKQVTGQKHWHNVLPPSCVETIVVELDGAVWKYSRYYVDQQDYSAISNPTLQNARDRVQSIPDQYEMYKLTDDQLETTNLVHPGNETRESIVMRPRLQRMLDEQRALKALTPREQGVTRADGEGVLATA
ncbi:MAG TPA: sulfatase-like hydrolase/transferase [Thermoanaerobaculia bacterium]|nr:sulfatase-like hydrolase/transferase [Thermoanaerobaculia bacterium]